MPSLTNGRRHASVVLVVATVVVLTLAGCGQEPPGAADGVTGASATTAPASGPTKPLTKKQAKAALLTEKDLPSGWNADEQGDVGDDTTETKPASCALIVDAFWKPVRPAVSQAQVSFTSEGMTTNLMHSVASNREGAAAIVDQVADAAGECGTFTSVPDDGEVTLSVLSFPDLGDRSAAVRLKTTLGELSLTFDLVSVADGGNLVFVAAGGPKTLPRDDLESVTRKAVAKLR